MIDLKPLAPVFLRIAFCAIALRASFANESLTPSISNNLEYCFVLYRKKQEFVGGTFGVNSEKCNENQKYTQLGSIYNVRG